MTETSFAAPVTVAKLDAKNRLVGIEQVSEAESAGRLRVHPKIDLPLDGTYEWQAEHGRFHPISHKNAHVPAPANDDELFYAILNAMLAAGASLPEHVVRWLKWYEAGPVARDEEKRRLGGR